MLSLSSSPEWLLSDLIMLASARYLLVYAKNNKEMPGNKKAGSVMLSVMLSEAPVLIHLAILQSRCKCNYAILMFYLLLLVYIVTGF